MEKRALALWSAGILSDYLQHENPGGICVDTPIQYLLHQMLQLDRLDTVFLVAVLTILRRGPSGMFTLIVIQPAARCG